MNVTFSIRRRIVKWWQTLSALPVLMGHVPILNSLGLQIVFYFLFVSSILFSAGHQLPGNASLARAHDAFTANGPFSVYFLTFFILIQYSRCVNGFFVFSEKSCAMHAIFCSTINELLMQWMTHNGI